MTAVTFGQLAIGDRFLFRDDRSGGGRHGVSFRVKVSTTEYETHWRDGKVDSHEIDAAVSVTRRWQ